MKPSRAFSLFALSTSLLVSACASAGSTTSSGGSGQRLSQADLVRANSESVFDAVTKLKPEWLTSRGPTSVTNATPTTVDVYMNGNNMGSAEFLKELRVVDVAEIRYYSAGQASARFGMGHPRGVLEVTHK